MTKQRGELRGDEKNQPQQLPSLRNEWIKQNPVCPCQEWIDFPQWVPCAGQLPFKFVCTGGGTFISLVFENVSVHR